jgi:hypothetical protein
MPLNDWNNQIQGPAMGAQVYGGGLANVAPQATQAAAPPAPGLPPVGGYTATTMQQQAAAKNPGRAEYNQVMDWLNKQAGFLGQDTYDRMSEWAKQATNVGAPKGMLSPSAPGMEGNEGFSGYESRPGVDRRNWAYIYNPQAYQYGGHAGLGDSEAQRYMNQANSAYGQMGAAQQQFQGGIGLSDEARQQQVQGLNYLQGMATGTGGPSAAAIQQNQGLAAARAQQASIAASARGGGAGLAAAQQQAAQQAGAAGNNAVQQGALLRSQEQMNAIGQYGQQAGALRASDFQRAQLAAGQQQMYGQQANENERFRGQVYAQQQNGMQAGEAQNLAREGGERGWTLAQNQADNSNTQAWVSAGLSAAGIAAMALSDARAKENITDASSDVDDAMNKLAPFSYDYKSEKGRAMGPQVGIMAQHLESSKAGKTAVAEGPGGLRMVKLPQATGLALAGLARLNQRLRDLEGRDARK